MVGFGKRVRRTLDGLYADMTWEVSRERRRACEGPGRQHSARIAERAFTSARVRTSARVGEVASCMSVPRHTVTWACVRVRFVTGEDHS